MANRDYCVDVLIPLNECRRENYYLPWVLLNSTDDDVTAPREPRLSHSLALRARSFARWKCEHERHAYELCQYKLYKLRTEH